MTDTVEPVTREEREHYQVKAKNCAHIIANGVEKIEWDDGSVTPAGDDTAYTDILGGYAAMFVHPILAYESALRASEERIKKLEVRINAVFGLLNSAFEEQESLLKNDYLFSAFSHVFPATTPTEE